MPDIITHYYLAMDTKDKIKESSTIRIIEKNFELFRLGAQGPDILFYYNSLPWQNDKGVNQIGSLIHRSNVSEFFIEAFRYIKGIEEVELKDRLTSYMLGFLCHYAMDSICHPYIYYMTGDDKLNPAVKYDHKRFEAIIDTLYVLKREGNPKKFTQLDAIVQTTNSYMDIEPLLMHLLKIVFDMELPGGIIIESVKHKQKVIKLMQDKTYIKRKIVFLIELLMGIGEGKSTWLYPSSLDDSIDYLNDSNKIWSHPIGDRKSCASFENLFAYSETYSLKLIEYAMLYLNDEINEKKLEKIIGNKSYNTGRTLDTNQEMKEFINIFGH